MTFQMKSARALVAAVVMATSLGISAKADAATIQLGFILDRSGSIGAGNWTTIVNGLSSAVLTNIPLAGVDTYEVSVVSFANGATADVSNTLIVNAANRAAVAAAIAAIPFSGGSTDFAAAFSTMQTVLSNTIANASATYVNFATDGIPNSNAAGVAARDAMIAIGVDNLSIEGIGGGVNAALLQGSYCYPQPCDTTSPYNFPTQGFYIGVADAQGYADAIGNKIKVVTGVPEPATLSLLGLGLAGLVARRRKAV